VATAVLAAVLAGVWVWRILFPGDERLIRQLLAEAAQTASVKPNENPIFKLAGANKLVGFFSPDAVVKVEVAGLDTRSLSGRDDLLQAVAAARAGLQEARIQLHEVAVQVDPAGRAATAQLVATAYLNGTGNPVVQELRLQLGKIEGRWKIVRVETMRGLGM
jgi:ketosteroid isomerase-like protein